MQHGRSLFSGILAAAIVLAFVAYEDFVESESFRQLSHIQVLVKLSTVRAHLESELNARFNLAHGLAALVKSRPEFTSKDFQVFAMELMKGKSGIRSVQLAPNAVVTYIYPIASNEAALGYDLRADPARRKIVEKSIREHKFIVSGPVKLKQGGVALIGRQPIYIAARNGSSGEDKFWGFSTVLIDLPHLLLHAGLDNNSRDLRVALRGVDGLGAEGQVFYGKQDVFTAHPILQDVTLPNGSWQLAGIPMGGWDQARPDRPTFLIVGFIVALGVGALFYFLVRRTSELKLEVEEHLSTGYALKLAKQDADKANLSKSEFLMSMSHELRTPLNAVLGFAQMLQLGLDAKLTPTQDEYVGNIIQGGGHLLELVNEILDLAKIEADQTILYLEDLKAGDIIAECVGLIKPLSISRGITVENKFKYMPLAIVRSDRQRLKQILLNLLSNAVKYNNEGGHVVVNAITTQNNFLHISVEDNGIGIAKCDFDSVFEIFHRLNIDPMVAREGTGIGLTVTKHLVERLGGGIGFESVEGQGSTFWVKIPLVTNEKILIWTDSFRIGVDAIDKDHQVIFALLNKITHKNENDTDFDDMIASLIDYVCYHFKREEKVMESCGCPDLKEHRKLHRDHLERLMTHARCWSDTRSPQSLSNLQNFLRFWLIDHVGKEDISIAQYTKGKERELQVSLNEVSLKPDAMNIKQHR